jgi:hypothetical protein
VNSKKKSVHFEFSKTPNKNKKEPSHKTPSDQHKSQSKTKLNGKIKSPEKIKPIDKMKSIDKVKSPDKRKSADRTKPIDKNKSPSKYKSPDKSKSPNKPKTPQKKTLSEVSVGAKTFNAFSPNKVFHNTGSASRFPKHYYPLGVEINKEGRYVASNFE